MIKVTTTNVSNNINYDKKNPILIFEYGGQFFKVLPEEEIDLHIYAKNNLLINTKYKIFNNIDEILGLTIEQLQEIFKNPDGIT